MNRKHRIVQLLAGFVDGDAISVEAQSLHHTLQGMGFESHLYADDGRIAPTMADLCQPLSKYRNQRSDLILYHYSIASRATDIFLSSTGKKILKYHNITPAEFFYGFNDDIAAQLTMARADLHHVGLHADAVWADSKFNASELEKLGVSNVLTVPLFISRNEFETDPDPRMFQIFPKTMKTILFVGRIAPNKCMEDLLLAFAWYKRIFSHPTRLIIVGSQHTCPRYYAMLRILMRELDTQDINFLGFRTSRELCACFKLADVFVCPSRHEGYGVPLLESMFNEVPVIARLTGATPETMEKAGILYEDLAPEELAELIHRVLEDEALRAKILRSQKRRIEKLFQRNTESELRALLAEIGIETVPGTAVSP